MRGGNLFPPRKDSKWGVLMNSKTPSAKQSSDIKNVLSSFFYPLCKEGLVLLLVVGVVGLGIQLLQHIVRHVFFGGLLPGILKLMLWGSILGYVLHVITKTADGENTPPDWQDIGTWNDILRPIFLLIGTVIVSFGPAISWSICVKNGYINPSPVFWLLIVWGCFYSPMALTAVAMMDNFSPLNPVVVLLSIVRAGWVYLYACLTLIIATSVTYWLAIILPRVPYLTTFCSSVCLMYLLMVTGRICGLIYRLRREKLNWMCE